jgi:hypothetical protein
VGRLYFLEAGTLSTIARSRAASVPAKFRWDKQTVAGRVRQFRKLRGISLSKDERGSALAFPAGLEIPQAMAIGSM